MALDSRVLAESIATRSARSVKGRSNVDNSLNIPRAINASTYVYATSSSGTYAEACARAVAGRVSTQTANTKAWTASL